MSKEPSRFQYSNKLSYQSHTPAFLQRLQHKVSGAVSEDEDDEYEYDGSGRPPIPKRPAIPERPEGDRGSADEDEDDEAPQIVVLKEGKHLSEREVENEKRKAKGLPPLPQGEEASVKDEESEGKIVSLSEKEPSKPKSQGLSFSSSGASSKSSGKKRKVIGSTEDDDEPRKKSSSSKKPKKAQKKLLSFGDEA